MNNYNKLQIEIIKSNNTNSIKNIEIHDYNSVIGIDENDTYIQIYHNTDLFNDSIFQELIDDSKNNSTFYDSDLKIYETQIIL